MTEFHDIVDATSEEISDLLNTLSKNTQSSEQIKTCPRCLKRLHPKNNIHTCTPHKGWKGD